MQCHGRWYVCEVFNVPIKTHNSINSEFANKLKHGMLLSNILVIT